MKHYQIIVEDNLYDFYPVYSIVSTHFPMLFYLNVMANCIGQFKNSVIFF